ncbi:nitrate reductase molybdenum cofactor assembly chaperone [Paenibacillus sp. M1]|uniref:Nitrate reductase molybdenum cofactor assembly chaperone n=1 Tax=Paenibacillus haidiansis TaxID=1574488 RepID=A0ABU7VPX5_9BACL
MIDLVKLNGVKEAFGFFARQLAYPDKLSLSQMTMDGAIAPSIASFIDTYRDKMQQLSMDEIEELYVDTFDFQKSSTLYMTYFKYEDNKERGNMLSTLKAIYDMYGLEIADNELPDYLPLMCEFIYAANLQDDEWSNASINTLLSILEDGTYHLMKALEKCDSPYFYLVKALRETFKLCLRKEAMTS